tara:strand:- start:498 stop:914 length:417 start_codon:yes stop_codon:yes gene_type:complete
MEDFILRVKCPVCLEDDGEENTGDNLVLLGDEEQNMQCLGCGFGSNNNMKDHISDNPFPQEFKDVCRKLGKRFWVPSVFTTENYQVVPMVESKELKWRIFAHVDPKTEVKVPSFADAFKMVEKLEKLIGHKIQQQKNN